MDFNHTRLSWRRPLSSYSKVQQAYSALIRGRRIQVWRLAADRRYLNVGCGPNLVPGFIHLDYAWSPGIDLCWDVSKGIPLPDRSLDGVYTEHCFEHLPLEAVRDVLRECRRVLRPAGTIRVVVPDAELYLDLYRRAKAGEQVTFPYQTGDEVTPLMCVNRVFREYGHCYAYDSETLAVLLQTAGFHAVKRAAYREGRDSALLIDSADRASESLYIEATP